MAYKITGIYCIENIVNHKKYIGQSVNIKDRWKHHINSLKRNEHDNKYLQRSYQKYGENNFKFYLLEECSKEELDEKEKYWIKKLDTYQNGYNLTTGGSGIKTWIPTDEFKNKMSQIVSGKNNPNYGNKWTDEMKENLSKKRKGLYVKEGNPNSKKIICVEKLKVYNTIIEASEDCGCKNSSSITRCLKDKTNIANNYHFVLYNCKMYEYLKQHQFEYLCECYQNKKIYADLTNKKFYLKYELKKKLYSSLKITTRELDDFLKQKQFCVNDIQYVLL